MGLVDLETGEPLQLGAEVAIAKVQDRLVRIAEDTTHIAELAAVLVRQMDADWEVGAGYWRAEETKSAIEALRQALVARRLLPGQPGAEPPLRLLITSAEARLLETAIKVREVIDRECGPGGSFTSEDPKYARKKDLFDVLHEEEAAAWEAVKQERAR